AIRLHVETGPKRLGQRPIAGLAPQAAVVEPAGRCLPPGAAPHDENPHRRFAVDTVVEPLDPAIEPATSQFEEILGEILIDRRGRSEINLTRVTQRAIAMRPRAENQLRRPA